MKKKLYAFLPAFFTPMSLFAEATAAPAGGNMTRTLSFFGVVLALFYLTLWRPEQKRRKKMQSLRNSLKPGDQITAMGILGEVSEIRENTLVLKMIDGTKIEMLKAAISEVHIPSAETQTEKKQTPAEKPEPVQS